MNQNHFTLSFPLKFSTDAKLLADELPALMPELFRANDLIGTVHYSRFTVLSEKTYFIAVQLILPRCPAEVASRKARAICAVS
ncbi:hypothetical protein ABIB73_003548 [Bradyrhizobium sp. F1.4.3]|uniref:hypothetical protein n=1 Tax=Bradyrhizobium sp. F1.4.3 TaxID=3156356 RepID=UPI00339A792C